MSFVSALRRADPAGLVVAGLLLVIAAVIFVDTARLDMAATYGLGPTAVPHVIATGFVLLAIGNLAMAIRRDMPERDEADPKAIFLILAGLAALMALIGLGAGFIVATAVLFTCTSSAFGRRAFLVDALLGLALGTGIYLVFVKLLTLGLPEGPLERLL